MSCLCSMAEVGYYGLCTATKRTPLKLRWRHCKNERVQNKAALQHRSIRYFMWCFGMVKLIRCFKAVCIPCDIALCKLNLWRFSELQELHRIALWSVVDGPLTSSPISVWKPFAFKYPTDTHPSLSTVWSLTFHSVKQVGTSLNQFDFQFLVRLWSKSLGILW